MSEENDHPLHAPLAEPALIPHLLRQSHATQGDLAIDLGSTQQRLSRIANGKADLSASEFMRISPKLALGSPGADDCRGERDEAIPTWTVTRWHANAAIEPPPVTEEGELPVFVNFREAELAVDYLRCFSRLGTPVAVPSWRQWLVESLAARGLDSKAIVVLAPPDETDDDALQDYVDRIDGILSGLLRAFTRRQF